MLILSYFLMLNQAEHGDSHLSYKSQSPTKPHHGSAYSSPIESRSKTVIEEPIKPIKKSLESIQRSIENIHDEVKSEMYDSHKR